MKRIVSALSLMLLSLVAFAQGEATTKTGVALQEQHKIVVEARSSSKFFDEIEVSRAIRLVVEERTTGNIIVRAPQDVMPYVSLRVEDKTLHATILPGLNLSRNSNLLAEVYIPNNGCIKEISTSSAARVVVKPTLVAHKLDLELTGASVIELKAQVGELSVEASGASTVKADVVVASELDMELSGASEVTISGTSYLTDVDLSGASTAYLSNLTNSTLKAEASGASTIKAKADRVAIIKVSGASNAEVKCEGVLTASASGASEIIYSGACQVNILSNTGASTISKK